MTTKFAPGARGPAPALAYTAEQYAVIHLDLIEAQLVEALADPDIDPAEQLALEAKLAEVRPRIVTVRAANGDRFVKAEFANHAITPLGEIIPIDADLAAHMTAALVKTDARKATEVADHLAEGRFLFVLNEQGCPLIYFQCATEGNPEYTPAVVGD